MTSPLPPRRPITDLSPGDLIANDFMLGLEYFVVVSSHPEAIGWWQIVCVSGDRRGRLFLAQRGDPYHHVSLVG